MSTDAKPSNVRELYLQAVRIEENEARQAFLDEACGGQIELRQRVEQLLAARAPGRENLLQRATSDSMSGSSSFSWDGDDIGKTIDSHPEAMGVEGTHNASVRGQIDVSTHPMIDNYRLLEELGHGGMGTVYMAAQSKPVKRQVALKVIKPGMDSKEVIARFEAERQALAMMDHPHIARVLDGGTTDEGRPYFVMELVRGVPITEFCKRKSLPLRERLELFVDVCHAVQHAHQKGIIHRDLKPSNIMVTLHDGKPVVKVIDFGVAKALHQELTERTLFTQFSQMLGTPLYMAPEQAEMSGLGVDTRSDIYSLGVVLYELLTGTTPFDRDTMSKLGIDGIRKLIQEQEPQRPSARISTLKAADRSTIEDQRQLDTEDIAKQLNREVDWIVMKALEKDRERRYETASAFAADIQRYLNDEPVEAYPPSAPYRLMKYAKKHRGLLTTAAILAAMLITATIVSTGFAMVARAAQAAAEKSADDADKQRQTAVDAEKLADQRLEAEKTARQLAEQERERADESFAAALVAIEQLLSHVGNPELAGIPKMQEIRASILEDSLDFYENFKADSGTSPEVDYRAAKVYLQLGELAQATHPESQEVIGAYNAGLKLSDALIFRQPKRDEFRELNAEMHMACADYWHLPRHMATKEDYARAMKHFEQAEKQYAHLSQAARDHDHYSRLRGSVFRKMSGLYYSQSKTDPRIAEFAKRAFELGFISHPLMAQVVESSDPELAEQHWRKFVAGEGELADTSGRITGILNNKRSAALFFSKRDPELADRLWQEIIPAISTLEKDFPSNALHWQRWTAVKSEYVTFLIRTNGVPQALRLMNALVESDSAFHVVRAEVLRRWDDVDEKSRLLGESIRRFPTQSEYYVVRARALEKKGELDAALADFNDVLALDGNHQYAISSRGRVHTKLQNYRQAIDDLTRLSSLRNTNYWGWRKYRANALFHLGDYDASLTDMKIAMDKNPYRLSSLTWISPSEIAECEDEDFKNGMLQLLDRAVEVNEGSLESRTARALLLIGLGQIDRARDEFFEIIERDDATYYQTYQAALIALKLDDRAAFGELSQKTLSAEDDASEPIAKHFAAWTASLAPDALDDYEPAIRLARQTVEKEPSNQQYINGLGAILMRAGKYEEAQEQLEKALEAGDTENTSPSYIHYFLAMTRQALGDTKEAQTQLRKANEIAESELSDSPAWNRRLTLQLLRKEAESQITPSQNGPDVNSKE